MIRGRTDEPLTTDADVRHRRAWRMARLIREMQPHEEPASPDEDQLALWVAKCLLAHECDTLNITSEAVGVRSVVGKARKKDT